MNKAVSSLCALIDYTAAHIPYPLPVGIVKALPRGDERSSSPLLDPFSAALHPPPNETREQRRQRLRAEEEARKRSENIDAMLNHDRKRNARKKTVKVLLLGQSESGKSTTLKREFSCHFIYPNSRPRAYRRIPSY